MATVGRFLVVCLEEDLAAHYQTLRGVYALLRVIPGVRAVTDLAVLSRETVDQWLSTAEQLPAKRKARR